ncbi:type 1 fimbrial protein [Salmonella enterica]|nr:type 1 fimbrial protein [Salmonella enterica]
MKHAEKAGNNNAGRVNVARWYHPSRLSAVSGLALFLSAGLSGSASALSFTFEYTYTIVANTCTLSAQGTDKDGPITGSSASFDVDWGTVTKEELTNRDKAKIKTFGLLMKCDGAIYQPTLTVTGSSPSVSDVFYVADSPNSVAGFAVQAAKSSDATEPDVTTKALNNNGAPQTLSEKSKGNLKKILLDAWPTIMPDKSIDNLKSGTEITGTVTIKVSYN